MKRIAKAAAVVSLAIAASTAIAQSSSSAYPMGSDPYYPTLNNSPAATIYSNPTSVTEPSSAEFKENTAQSPYPTGSNSWSNYVRGEPETFEPNAATARVGGDTWPQAAEGPEYWTTHAYGGKALAGTEDAKREQQRQAQLQHLRMGS